jgi:hypothetical protein
MGLSLFQNIIWTFQLFRRMLSRFNFETGEAKVAAGDHSEKPYFPNFFAP